MRSFGSWKVVVLASVALSFVAACGPKKYNKKQHPRYQEDDTSESTPRPRAQESRQGVADANTWLALEGFGAKLRVPQG